MDKIIFLDCDGVLNSTDFFNSLEWGRLSRSSDDMLDAKAIDCLNEITRQSGASIVISSDWRIGYQNNRAGLRGDMAAHGIKAPIVGMTPVDTRARWKQIREYLTTVKDIFSFVILDDTDLGEPNMYSDRLIQTEYAHGLLPEHIPLAVKILETACDNSHRVIVG